MSFDQKKRRTLKVMAAAPLVTSPAIALALTPADHDISAEIPGERPELVVVCVPGRGAEAVVLHNRCGEPLEIDPATETVPVPGGVLDVARSFTALPRRTWGDTSVPVIMTDQTFTGNSDAYIHQMLRFPLQENVVVGEARFRGAQSGKMYRLPVRLERV
ncbi:MAG: hypothetical protein AAF402_14645 [Pseudomonadota bacterium]